MAYRIAIDTGGTFTDAVILAADGSVTQSKALTTLERNWLGMREALELGARARGIELEELLGGTELLFWGTTRATNAIVEKTTARTALLTTEGFPDTLILREGGKLRPFNFREPFPEPFIPRNLTFEVPERIDAEGNVVVPFDGDRAAAVLERVRAAEVEAIAVCFLWSIVNPAHELAMGEAIEQALPGVPYTLSHQLNPVVREYRRTSSAAIDASLKPLMQEHVAELERDLRGAGFEGELLLLTSFGGCMHAHDIVERPIYAVDSGPSVAPVGAAAAARASGVATDLIVCDTGGTSFDVALVDGGAPRYTRERWIGERFVGHLTGLSAVDLRSIGAGGGSIAHLDEGGLLQVGPRSAGSTPGPACYGRGGTEPTVTDAALLLGYIDPAHFLGGRMQLDAGAAREAMRTRVAEPLGLGVEEAAEAVLLIVNDKMVTAINEITVNAGIDPRERLVVAGGGASSLNIVPIATELGCPQVLVPRLASTLSAAGAHEADVMTEFHASEFLDTAAFDVERANSALGSLDREMDRFLRGLNSSSLVGFEKQFFAEARYPSQVWELEVPLPAGRVTDGAYVEEIAARFHEAHERLYASRQDDSHLEIPYLKGRVVARLAKVEPPRLALDGSAPAERCRATARFDGETVETPRYRGEQMSCGAAVEGPAIVDLESTTIVVNPGWRCEVTAAGDFLLTNGREGAA